LDQILVLRFGQLVTLHGEASNGLSHLLCIRAVYPLPPGLDSDVVFVDGGNVFDVYTVSRHAFSLGLDQEKTKLRIHLSRAFTHHQLSGFIPEGRSDRTSRRSVLPLLSLASNDSLGSISCSGALQTGFVRNRLPSGRVDAWTLRVLSSSKP